MTLLLQIIAAVLLGMGSWLIFRFVLQMDAKEWDQTSDRRQG